MLTVGDRVEIATRLKAGWSIRAIAEHIDRCPSVVSLEVRRNATKTRGYKIVTADCRAQRRRARPQRGKVAADPVLRARVLADLKRSRTPRQIAGRSHLEASDDTVGLMNGSEPAHGRTVSHEALYRFVYALPKGELARHGVMLRSKRTRRRRFKPVDRCATFTALPAGKDSVYLADALIEAADDLPAMMRKSLTWDQGSEMAKHAALTLATTLPGYFATPAHRGSAGPTRTPTA